MKPVLSIFILLVCTLLHAAAAANSHKNEYTVIEVLNGSTLSGRALFRGLTPPQDEVLTLTSEQDVCGDNLPAEKYIINERREIKNVVVYLADIQAGKEIPTTPLIIDNVLCAFKPHVSIGYKGNTVLNRNSDPVLHGFHVYVGNRFGYNLAIPVNGMEVKRELRKAGLMKITCNPHPWMISYAYIFPHPYAAVTDEDGQFSIQDIPAGSYEVEAWHEGFGYVSFGNVAVEAGKTTEIELGFK